MDLLAYILSRETLDTTFQKLKLHEPRFACAFFFVFRCNCSSKPILVLFAIGWLSVTSVPTEVRRHLGLSDFYQKRVEVGNFSVLGSNGVSDFALKEAAFQFIKWWEEIRIALNPEPEQDSFAVMARNEFTPASPSIPIYTHHSTGTAGLAVWGLHPPSG